jgi:hypothetical protein
MRSTPPPGGVGYQKKWLRKEVATIARWWMGWRNVMRSTPPPGGAGYEKKWLRKEVATIARWWMILSLRFFATRHHLTAMESSFIC